MTAASMLKTSTLDAQFEPVTLLGFLGLRGAKLARVPFGRETDVWRVERGKNVYALRVFCPGEHTKQLRELEALEVAGAAGIPVPERLAHGVWRDRAFLLLTWLPGTVLGSEISVRTSPERLEKLARALGRILAALHCVSTPLRWRDEPHSWVKLAGPDELELQTRLLKLPLRHDSLLHLDYHPFNVMVQGERITGVLDWSGARAGDPRADIAKFVTLATFAPISPRPGAPERTPADIAMRQHAIAAFTRGYQDIAEPGEEMALFYAWAGASIYRNASAKVGEPGQSVEMHHLDSVRHWTDAWKAKAGLYLEDANRDLALAV